MLSVGTGPVIGELKTMTTSGRGLNADEIMDLLMPRLLHVGDNAPPAIREQAAAFKGDIERLVRHYVVQAQKSQNTTICGVLERAGQHEAAELVRKL